MTPAILPCPSGRLALLKPHTDLLETWEGAMLAERPAPLIDTEWMRQFKITLTRGSFHRSQEPEGRCGRGVNQPRLARVQLFFWKQECSKESEKQRKHKCLCGIWGFVGGLAFAAKDFALTTGITHDFALLPSGYESCRTNHERLRSLAYSFVISVSSNPLPGAGHTLEHAEMGRTLRPLAFVGLPHGSILILP